MAHHNQHTRRAFLQTSVAAGAFAATTAGVSIVSAKTIANQAPAERATKNLRLLFLGGTGFLGPPTVEYAIARGHEVTLFNRRRTNIDLFPELEKLKGDRDPNVGDGLSAIETLISQGRTWDAVIDTSGHFPRIVGASARMLQNVAGLYLFISSISVYPDLSILGLDEEDAVGQLPDPEIEEFGPSFEYYGPLKAACEEAAEAAMPGRACRIRPGLIVGPRDFSDRFTYWPVRVSQGGEVLAPGTPADPVQYIDVRDLGRFMVTCCENGTAGTFNATGPVHGTTIAELLYGCKAVTGGDARFTWVEADFLASHGVMPWGQMPAWAPSEGPMAGIMRADCSRANAAGLTTRPLAETVRATLEWFRSLPDERQAMLSPEAVQMTAANAQDPKVVKRRVGVSASKEQEVLAAWHARGSTG